MANGCPTCGCRVYRESGLCQGELDAEALRRERDDLNALATTYGERIEQLQQERDEAVAVANRERADTDKVVADRDRLLGQRHVLQAKLQRARAGRQRIMRKCEQYWNETGIEDAEIHAILEFIYAEAEALADLAEGGDDAKPE